MTGAETLLSFIKINDYRNWVPTGYALHGIEGRIQSPRKESKCGGNKDNNHHSYVYLAGTSKCESLFISDSSFGHPANSLTQLQQVLLSSVCKIGRDWNSENLSNLLRNNGMLESKYSPDFHSDPLI